MSFFRPSKRAKSSNSTHENRDSTNISGNLEQNVDKMLRIFGENDDFVVRRIRIFGQFPAAFMNFSNLTDEQQINSDVLKSLMRQPFHKEIGDPESFRLEDFLLSEVLYHEKAQVEKRFDQIVEAILQGKSVLLADGMDAAIVIDTRRLEKRAVDQPQTEQVIRGPREGFIEQLGTNLALLRYRLQTADFRVKTMKIGRLTKSTVAICYIKGIANPALVEEVQRRLSAIDIDGVIDAGYLEQFIEDHHLSPFPQIQNTERPDKAVSNLLEGRVIILMDGSPFALIVPSVFSQFYQSMEDYSERFVLVSFIRFARLIALVFSLIFPSLYVAIISFNPELIPTEFAVAVAGGRAGVPFPAVIEVLVMETTMEVLREATIRLPQQVGGALSIVGVLVVGQAAVSAGFASPITVVIIALTTIGSFATPAYNAALALRLLRFPLVILAGTFGLYGVMIGLILIANHMLSLKSFGVPYISPIVPGNFQSLKDSLVRAPLWSLRNRPAQLHTPDDTRLGETEQIHASPRNTLDPLKVGNDRWESEQDGVSTPDHNVPGGGNSH